MKNNSTLGALITRALRNVRGVRLGPGSDELRPNEGDGCRNMQLNAILYFKKRERNEHRSMAAQRREQLMLKCQPLAYNIFLEYLIFKRLGEAGNSFFLIF